MSPEPEFVLSDLPGVMEKLDVALPSVLQGGSPLPLGLALGLDGVVSDISRRAGYAVRYDGPGGAADDVFDAMSHAEIYGKVSEFTPDTLQNMANNWRTIGGNASKDAGQFASDIGNVIGQDWQGAAAEAAGAGVQRYAVSAVELMIASHTFSGTIAAAHDALSDTKSSVPAPQPISKTDRVLDVFASVGNLVVPGSMKNSQFERDEAEEQARTIMKTLYQPAIRDASDRIPVLPRALDPLNGGEAGGSGSGSGHYVPYGGSSGSTWSGGGTPSSGGSLTGPQSDPDGRSGSTATTTPSTPQETTTQAAGWTPTSGDSAFGAPTASAAGNGAGGGSMPGGGSTSGGGSMLGAPVGGQGGAAGPGAAGPGFPRSNGRLGGGSGAGGMGGPGGFGAGPRGGSSLGGSAIGGSTLGGAPSGGPSGTGGSAGGVAGATTAQGRPGAPGMGAMAPGAGRSGTDGDDVHKTPGYLVDAINGDELIGTLPLVAPPVLGE
ncbi:hypothetical protein HQ346_17065 [Rhodococcus sp. BP-252]|uniref:PPE family protein n=1 Tax=Rhodococcoides kyotonense TaxID=398843 RepID=A0A177Y8G1_9NOCA|nr:MULTISPECIES: hypothetical protein [Rhodococcus]MBY6413408.1 hypothetical protein [Rhodococcus sp. BP-320]MBY6418102.1 hypothetical protein [Rhodococcus sp. BP-321]MBY6422417.1 hypothetical protein [Rhodococcus sp. BP-324]MBY6426387.1 hypothetical protein [Rhodococcus sp. BP-323]MBY6431386.1 hypothetical protein [Rhodococcus sp. BP-322]